MATRDSSHRALVRLPQPSLAAALLSSQPTLRTHAWLDKPSRTSTFVSVVTTGTTTTEECLFLSPLHAENKKISPTRVRKQRTPFCLRDSSYCLQRQLKCLRTTRFKWVNSHHLQERGAVVIFFFSPLSGLGPPRGGEEAPPSAANPSGPQPSSQREIHKHKTPPLPFFLGTNRKTTLLPRRQGQPPPRPLPLFCDTANSFSLVRASFVLPRHYYLLLTWLTLLGRLLNSISSRILSKCCIKTRFLNLRERGGSSLMLVLHFSAHVFWNTLCCMTRTSMKTVMGFLQNWPVTKYWN